MISSSTCDALDLQILSWIASNLIHTLFVQSDLSLLADTNPTTGFIAAVPIVLLTFDTFLFDCFIFAATQCFHTLSVLLLVALVTVTNLMATALVAHDL